MRIARDNMGCSVCGLLARLDLLMRSRRGERLARPNSLALFKEAYTPYSLPITQVALAASCSLGRHSGQKRDTINTRRLPSIGLRNQTRDSRFSHFDYTPINRKSQRSDSQSATPPDALDHRYREHRHSVASRPQYPLKLAVLSTTTIPTRQ